MPFVLIGATDQNNHIKHIKLGPLGSSSTQSSTPTEIIMTLKTSSPIRLTLILLALTFTFGGAALAQQPLGAISGVVADPNGAVLKGATATATSLATGTSRSATTNDQGFFLIPTLQAGDYK